jgi:hypothetical protein
MEIEPTDYLYDRANRRRVRFLADGTLEDERRDPDIGFWVQEPSFPVGRLVTVPLALFASAFFGAALERHGPLNVLLWIVAAAGFLVFLFCAMGLQERGYNDSVPKRWLIAGALIGSAVWAIPSIWLATR